MRINRQSWNLYFFIFIPAILLILLYQFNFYKELSYGTKFTIKTIIEQLTITIVYLVQFYLFLRGGRI